jgi:sec-independent protein translocase protein TatB
MARRPVSGYVTAEVRVFGIGPSELLVILVIALLVLGPKRLPELARSLGKALGEFRRATSDISTELDNARIMLEEETQAAARASREPNKGRGYAEPDDDARKKPDAAGAQPGPSPSDTDTDKSA